VRQALAGDERLSLNLGWFGCVFWGTVDQWALGLNLCPHCGISLQILGLMVIWDWRPPEPGGQG